MGRSQPCRWQDVGGCLGKDKGLETGTGLEQLRTREKARVAGREVSDNGFNTAKLEWEAEVSHLGHYRP